MVDLSESGMTTNSARGINDNGSIVGGRHILRGDGTLIALQEPTGFSGVTGYSINNNGEVTGSIGIPGGGGGLRSGFYYDGALVTSLGVNGFWTARDINNDGLVVGDGGADNFRVRVFDGSSTRSLLGIEARAVNDIGEIVGTANYSPFISSDPRPTGEHATLWVNTERVNLAANLADTVRGSEANDINNNGLIVGRAKDGNNRFSAFIYTRENGMQLLKDLIVNLTPEVGIPSSAIAVNDNGEIVGTLFLENDPLRRDDNETHAFLAIPVNVDSDGDGVQDEIDECPSSNLGNTVSLGNCNTSIINTLHDDGCTLNDDLKFCEEDLDERPRIYFRCVRKISRFLVKSNRIDRYDRRQIRYCAVRNFISSRIDKKKNMRD